MGKRNFFPAFSGRHVSVFLDEAEGELNSLAGVDVPDRSFLVPHPLIVEDAKQNIVESTMGVLLKTFEERGALGLSVEEHLDAEPVGREVEPDLYVRRVRVIGGRRRCGTAQLGDNRSNFGG